MSFYIYTDGSYTPKIPNYCGWGYVIVNDDDQIINENKGKIECESRQIDGECNAVIQALEYINKNIDLNIQIITIFYDYNGVHKWMSGEWKTNKNVSINYKTNVNLIISKLLKRNIKIEWVKVKAHSGNRWNDYADELCKNGLSQ